MLVQPNEQLTFEFQFYIDPSIEPRDYHMEIKVDYHDQRGIFYTTTFFSGAITVIEPEVSSDWTAYVFNNKNNKSNFFRALLLCLLSQ